MFFYQYVSHHKASRQRASFLFSSFTVLVWLFLFMITGCIPFIMQTERVYETQLPRPNRILVYDFAVSPEEVKPDQGVSLIVNEAANGISRTSEELKVGHVVADVLAKELVAQIQELGLSAERAFSYPPKRRNTLLIEGQLLSINEGNRIERFVIGFGAGRTDVEAHVQVYEMTAEGMRNMEDLQAVAKSTPEPGIIEMMGVGALAGRLQTSLAVSSRVSAWGEVSWETVEYDARRLAKDVSKELAKFFVSQGWIPWSAMEE